MQDRLIERLQEDADRLEQPDDVESNMISQDIREAIALLATKEDAA